ncbi:MAG: 3,4-dihydroxy 2-butanone 4-phosphate synthase/GTP cyclohydrolase II [Planctomycetaceae bacterium]|jgi:3,4-dihydroxy 2-butanone 4-phosphate synthase/GTP cyclohydrolase II
MSEKESSPSDFSSIDEGIAALKQGRMVVVLDADDRENEGDLICAAETITSEQVAFMLRYGGGVLCVPIDGETADRLHLTPLVEEGSNSTTNRTHFLTPVDHVSAGTGVSADNRAKTILALADPNAKHTDFVKPGHVDILLAKDGGTLRRAGHTEATLDLLRMAGMRPAGAIIEILSQKTTGMADRAELLELAAKYDMPMITIDDLLRYRRLGERLIHREVEVSIDTGEFGSPKFIAYKVDHEEQEPLAMVWGDLSSVEAPLVRMHSSCFTGDILGSLRCDCGEQLHIAMGMIADEGAGAVVYLPQEGRGIGLTAKLKAYELQDQGYDTVEANHKLGFKSDQRDYMIGLQILKDLGLSKIRLLTNNPKKTESFEQTWDLKVVEQVPLIAPPVKQREQYMATKRDKMGHHLPSDVVVEKSE